YAVTGTRAAYVLVHAALAGLFLLWIRRHQRYRTLSAEVALPVLLEAAIYALTLGAVISLVLDRLVGLGLGVHNLIRALGARIPEELVFRLALLGGIVAALRGRRWAFPVALVASALAFAGAHHLGRYGEPFTGHAFAFRALAGAAFGAIFWFRSLAHAVYA